MSKEEATTPEEDTETRIFVSNSIQASMFDAAEVQLGLALALVERAGLQLIENGGDPSTITVTAERKVREVQGGISPDETIEVIEFITTMVRPDDWVEPEPLEVPDTIEGAE